jgi:glycosyltransferase involved in cell wall biosynthesis
MIDVSVIIPCYNQGKYLDEAIQSVTRSQYEGYEIIIVNDGSTDNFTNQIISGYKHPRIRTVTTKNQGLAEARNTGIRLSAGKYILPLDADDKISPNYLAEGAKVLDEDESVKVVTCEVRLFGADHGKMQLLDFSLENLICQNTMVCSCLFRRRDYDLTRGYNPAMKHGFEDWDFWLSLMETGGSVHHIPKEHFFYRIKKKSMRTVLQQKENRLAEMRYQIYLNHKELFSRYFFDPRKSFEYILIRDSMEYKLGKWMLQPVRLLFDFIR